VERTNKQQANECLATRVRGWRTLGQCDRPWCAQRALKRLRNRLLLLTPTEERAPPIRLAAPLGWECPGALALAGWPLLLAGSGRSGRAAVENGLLVNGRYIF
jgi:hypothetical protein